jgi:hypothetical protein
MEINMTIKSLLPMTLAALLALGTVSATAQESSEGSQQQDTQQEQQAPSGGGSSD